jgi:hypothetical protein
MSVKLGKSAALGHGKMSNTLNSDARGRCELSLETA